jgi:hypothetical protein
MYALCIALLCMLVISMKQWFLLFYLYIMPTIGYYYLSFLILTICKLVACCSSSFPIILIDWLELLQNHFKISSLKIDCVIYLLAKSG